MTTDSEILSENSSPNSPPSAYTRTNLRRICNAFLDDDGVGWGTKLTPTQLRIIAIIASRSVRRSQITISTQYGKSLAVAFGVLLRAATFAEPWAIVAPTAEKAQIIMDYIIDHVFDSSVFSDRLEYSSKQQLEQHRSKRRITFKDAGEIRVYTANATSSTATRRALSGFGSPNVILDESALIGDDLYSMVHRMLGGSKDNFLLEIGNPYYRNHFYRTSLDPAYFHVVADCYQALKEGRYTREFIDAAREMAFFEVLYECKFPEEADILPSGYRRLVSNAIVDSAFGAVSPEGQPSLGIDVAAGGTNESKFVVRWNNYAKVAATCTSDDLNEVANVAEAVMDEYNIGEYRTCIDAGGVGHGLPSILTDRDRSVTGVLFGESAPDKAFANMRAWMYWQARTWLRDSNHLDQDAGFNELKQIYFKQNASGKTLIEPKEEMLKRGAEEGLKLKSPDTADAFALTFTDTSRIVDIDDV